MTTVFQRVGPYEILEEIGRGGMAAVFLATDTRTTRRVALKLVPTGNDREAREILEAERWGARLQEQFCRASGHVPAVYEHGTEWGYFYIAMEFLEGLNLSEVIASGPLSSERAAGIAAQLCEFLEAAHAFEVTIDGRPLRSLLHGDLKPRNIKVTADDRVKVLDFGIAKALSLSRKVTRNDFGSIAYLSPERLESGEIDPQADFWAIGVLLYEMVSGGLPFQAPDTRRLEQRIESRQPPASLAGRCTPDLAAVIGKLLAGRLEDRYGTAAAIREDLERVIAGRETVAGHEGWATRAMDEPPTRRTRRPDPVADEVTRRTQEPKADQRITVVQPPDLVGQKRPSAFSPWKLLARRPLLRTVLLFVALTMACNEIRVAAVARRLAATVPTRELDGLAEVWDQYDALSRGSLRIGVIRLEQALAQQTGMLSDRVIANYRTALPSVRETQWRLARESLARALSVVPSTRLKASLRYCDGHLHRIDGEARKARGKTAEAQQQFTDAVTAFREAAELRPNWPDPFLGLARTFIYGLEDVDRGADALTQAQRLGYTPGDRETTQLADGYRARGDALARTARTLAGLAQEQEYLTRAAEAYRRALELYAKVISFADVARTMRLTQRSLGQIEQRIADLSTMTLTYTPAAERDTLRTRQRARTIGVADLLMLATSCVALFAISLAYAGRVQVFEASSAQHSGVRSVNLNTAANAAELEPALAVIFDNAADRRFAARELFRFVDADRQAGRAQSNVGAITRATVRLDAIERGQRLDVLARRAQAARETARTSGANRPETMPLLTGSDLVAVKPFFVVRTRDAFRNQLLWLGGLYLLGFQSIALVWRLRRTRGDRVLLAAVHLLTAIGFAILVSRVDPLRDNLLFVRYTEGVLVGLLLIVALSLVDFGTATYLELSYLPFIGAVSLSVLLILFGTGPGRSSAKVNLGPVQPIEAIRLLLALFLAGFFARRWELLRNLRGRTIRTLTVPAWLDVPRGEYVLPVLVAVATALGFFFLQKDLGPALLLSCVFLAVYAVARGRAGLAVTGFVLLVAGFYVGYRLNISHTLAERVRMWQSPWDNAVAGGDQVAQAIWAIATGGPFGAGLGLGDTRYLPAGHTDLVLAAVGEDLGATGLIIVTLAYGVIAWRGFRVSRSASSDYGFFLATALTLFLIVPVLVMAAGVMGITPLTGVVTPFLSYGGSAMAANCAALGMLCSIQADRRPAADLTPFRAPMRWLVTALAASAAALVAVLIGIQVVYADEYAVKPHLGVQADGGRRYAYNPRILDVVRQLPRGTVYDRRGLPLATGDPAVVDAARQAYQELGVSLDRTCPRASERCYPLGGRAFHLLGDERTRVNWSAPNTSYVERDSENRLRGFDDRAATMQTRDSSGRPMWTIRRDYRDLVPLLRHRYEPDHPAVVALRRQAHDVRLTIDAGLQLRVSSIVAAYAKKSAGRAAAIVLDPDTGELLASASYPWPEMGMAEGDADDAEAAPDSLLDRARYGLYPPGSTFKLVTAAAALRRGVDPGTTTFACTRLPDGRVGARIKGWNRPIRDDVLDTHPHGTIDMHDGLVHSCNAYFAQLAMTLGPEALAGTAGQLGISLTPSKQSAQRVRDTLPQIGYGQGDVVATPMRMARVAAAIASDGVLRETHQEQTAAPSVEPGSFLDRGASRLLAGYMRDVVLTGTGRSLKTHPWRIAGKTGTAELAGRASHAWFVGFAPYGTATRRIAFAIILENAGYGGASAAPVAGEIVTAAAQSGLVQ